MSDTPDSSVDRAVRFERTSVAGSTPAQAICSKCDVLRDLRDFGLKNATTGKRHGYCKLCQQEMSRAHYRANRDAYYARNERRMRDVMAYVDEFKNQPCADCGNWFPPKVMDLHHLEDETKEDILSQLRRKTTLPKVKRELAKCIVLCANCHRLRTFYLERQRLLIANHYEV